MTVDERYPKSLPFVTELARRLCPAARVAYYLDSEKDAVMIRVEVDATDNSEKIIFGSDLMDDLEAALNRNGANSHDERLKSVVRFRTYITLGKAGLIPDFRVADEFVNESIPSRSLPDVRTGFDERMTEVLARGLQRLRTFLSDIVLVNKDLAKGLKPLADDLALVNGFLEYHEQNGHLNSSGVSMGTLSILKAAVLTELIELEVRKTKQAGVRFVVAALDREIYTLVEELRRGLFLDIKLPPWFSDYRRLAVPTDAVVLHPQTAEAQSKDAGTTHAAMLAGIKLLLEEGRQLEFLVQELLRAHREKMPFEQVEEAFESLLRDFPAWYSKILSLVDTHIPRQRDEAIDAVTLGRNGMGSIKKYIREGSQFEDVFDWSLESIHRLLGVCEAVKFSVSPVESSAEIDPLLQVFRREELTRNLQRIIDGCIRQQTPIALLMLDIDHFKKFNDSYGHQAGDDVLRTVASLIRRAVGHKGQVIRYGGEEMCVVLPNYAVEEALAVAETMRKRIEQYPFQLKGKGTETITVSFGIAVSNTRISDKDLIGQADHALRASKAHGRNRTTVFGAK